MSKGLYSVLAEGNVTAAHYSPARRVSRRPKFRWLFPAKPARATRACEIRLCDLVPKHTHRKPALASAIGTRYFRARTSVAVNGKRRNVARINGRMRLWKRANVSLSGQNKKLAATRLAGRVYNFRGEDV